MSQVDTANGHQMTAAAAPTNGTASTVSNGAHANGYTNGNGNGHSFEEKAFPHQAPQYNGGGTHAGLSRTLTPGGHYADDDLIAIANAHRKIANPLPLGVFGFSTTTLLLSLFNIQVAGIEVPNAVLGYAISYGGLAQFLAGLWEFASGNTFGATVFCSFGMFWWGYSVILIPFFGFVGTYNGQPGIYSKGSPYASEEAAAVGLYLWIWFGITTIYLVNRFAAWIGSAVPAHLPAVGDVHHARMLLLHGQLGIPDRRWRVWHRDRILGLLPRHRLVPHALQLVLHAARHPLQQEGVNASYPRNSRPSSVLVVCCSWHAQPRDVRPLVPRALIDRMSSQSHKHARAWSGRRIVCMLFGTNT
ncbi:hypothetical protein L1887_47722 [Cichorium endivia]|nr:hypothetical protein L1887_47722 [Cichorium endivia]